MKSILVVEDDTESTELLKEIFEMERWKVTAVSDPSKALELADEEKFDLLVSDINLETDISGIDLLERLGGSMPVILITGFGSLEAAVEATQLGAWDFISKPFKVDEIVQTARRALEAPGSDATSKEPEEAAISTTIIGRSPLMIELYKEIAIVAPTKATVLISGESGTGKELVARAIHENSPVGKGPFVAVNCGALTETLLESELFGYVKGAFTGAAGDRRGLWEEAKNGTLFLDEIGEISPAMQVKLLRALQENEIRRVGASSNTRVNARIIAATNRDLEKEVEEEIFREDLFYRLSAFTIRVPPLRDRKGDIPLLAEAFLAKSLKMTDKDKMAISDEALKLLSVYDWKGNVRELESAVEFAVLHSPEKTVMPADLPARINTDKQVEAASRLQLKEMYGDLPTLEEMERRYFLHVLEATGGNRTRSAKIMGIDRRTLYRMAERFEIELPEK